MACAVRFRLMMGMLRGRSGPAAALTGALYDRGRTPRDRHPVMAFVSSNACLLCPATDSPGGCAPLRRFARSGKMVASKGPDQKSVVSLKVTWRGWWTDRALLPATSQLKALVTFSASTRITAGLPSIVKR